METIPSLIEAVSKHEGGAPIIAASGLVSGAHYSRTLQQIARVDLALRERHMAAFTQRRQLHRKLSQALRGKVEDDAIDSLVDGLDTIAASPSHIVRRGRIIEPEIGYMHSRSLALALLTDQPIYGIDRYSSLCAVLQTRHYDKLLRTSELIDHVNTVVSDLASLADKDISSAAGDILIPLYEDKNIFGAAVYDAQSVLTSEYARQWTAANRATRVQVMQELDRRRAAHLDIPQSDSPVIVLIEDDLLTQYKLTQPRPHVVIRGHKEQYTDHGHKVR